MDENSKLSLRLKPILPGWLFTKGKEKINTQMFGKRGQEVVIPKNSYAYNFMNSTLVIYHNPGRKNTYGPNGAKAGKIKLEYEKNNKVVTLHSSAIMSPHALDIRNGLVKKIEVFFN